MPTYGMGIDKELHTKYMKLTHLYGVSAVWVADRMRIEFKSLVEELWEKHKEKHDKSHPNLIRDLINVENKDGVPEVGEGIKNPDEPLIPLHVDGVNIEADIDD